MKLAVTIFLSLAFSNSFAQSRYDVVIHEIMADPTPQVGLPNNEWIELRNLSASPVNLQGWRICDASGQSGPIGAFVLEPDSMVVICTGSAVTQLSQFGTTISVTSFPSLDNSGEEITLMTETGMVMHAVRYSADWYGNEIKRQGGWSLEMIDPRTPCTGMKNWKASEHSNGGTPGRENSVNAVNPDADPPAILRAYAASPTKIVLVMNEPVDSLSSTDAQKFSIQGMSVVSVVLFESLFDRITIELAQPMQEGEIYKVEARSLADCSGNVATLLETRVGIGVEPLPGDVVINEVMFNPHPGCDDYVEILNVSSKIIDASRLSIANRNSGGMIGSIQQLVAEPDYIFPGEYRLISTDPDRLGQFYLLGEPSTLFRISSMPSYPDSEGVVAILNSQGEVVDELAYDDKWHFALLTNTEGISLERVNPLSTTQNYKNWHSAASTAGYGTPGYKNSQLMNIEPIAGEVEVKPRVVSPDNDGLDDFTNIHYRLEEPGYVANVSIFDMAGRMVRMLVRNGTLSTEGYWTWDGLGETGLKLPIGVYVVFTEIFNLSGKKQSFKNTIILARKF